MNLTNSLPHKVMQFHINFTCLGTAIAVLTVVILIVKFCISKFVIDGEAWTSSDTAKNIEIFVKYFIIGVTVLVVAVPEGLPLAVTLALAYSVKVRLHINALAFFFFLYMAFITQF